MNMVQKVAVIIAMTGMAATLVAPSAKTAQVVTAGFNGLSGWQKAAEGR
jgi:ABC-type uncharacterized transport system substrate-binding protein